MNSAQFFYLLPYLLSLALSLGIFAYSWRHRHMRGAHAYCWFAAAEAFTIFGFIMEMISPSLVSKIVWDKFQWFTQVATALTFLTFALEFSDHKFRSSKWTWGLLSIVPFVFALLVITDDWHHLIYVVPHLGGDNPFPELQYEFGLTVYLYAVYFYLITFYGAGLLLWRAYQQPGIYRVQFTIIAVGFLIPVVLSIFSLLGINIASQRDSSPFTFAIGNLIVAVGLFRYRLFDITPIARERIVENMTDPVIVLDPQNRVVDINPAAILFLGRKGPETIGLPAADAFARWPFMNEMLRETGPQRREISTRSKGETYFFDISVSPILNTQQVVLGHIVVARDITRHKELERNYRALSEELEQRIHERTEELRESAERYRAVVENQTEFIVRWKPDRTRTFVNEAYCRYFGLTYEQAMQTDFLTLILEEDRPAVRAKIQRLLSGETDVETEVHRIPHSDGSVGWQEWTDYAIRDQNGQVVEFQSIGRDITDRMKAEDALRESESIYRKAIEVAGAVPYRQSYQQDENCFEFIGEGIRQLTGYGPEEFNDNIWTDITQERKLVGDLAGYSWDQAIERMRTGLNSIWECEYQIRTRQGALRWVYEAAIELRNKEGGSHGSIGLFQDITARKQAEDALRESEAIYRKAIETAGAVPYRQSYSSDAQRVRYDFVGEGIRELLGCEPGEFSALLWDSLVLESHLLDELAQYEWQEAIDRVRMGLDHYWKCEHRVRTLDGKNRWIFESAIELRDENGRSHGSIGLFQDITARKESEEALRKTEERFSTAFRASPIIITLSRISDARLLEVNETFEKITGYTRREVLGKSTFELGFWLSAEDRDKMLDLLKTHGEIRNLETRFRIKNGRVITCLVSGDIIELDGEKCVLSTIQDISERKVAEERILRLNRLYVTISQINQTIVHARDKESLFKNICRVAIDHGQFRMAWIGLVDGAAGNVHPEVFAGEERGYLDGLRINFHDVIEGRGPTGTAIREERCIISQDIANDPRMLPWREQALSRGYRSSAAVPLREAGCVIGALTVYASEVHGFDAEDEALIEQIGQDVSFALDSLAAEKSRQIAENNLAEAYDTTLEGWARALELRDKETEGHSRRVTETTLVVSRAMGFDEEALIQVRRGSILHDIGKMGIPDEILRKNGSLTPEERLIVNKHPITAYELLKNIPYLQKALEIPYSHHERWDGSGYPQGLQGEHIPLAARIFAVVDVWDALSSDRPYRTGWSKGQVVEYLLNESGKHFDPNVLKVFLQLLNEGKI